MRRLAVAQPGPRTTVEDLGRRHVGRFGVPPGGAFDALALRAANRMVGNQDDAAGLEMTLRGPDLHNCGDETILCAVAGADFTPTLEPGGGGRAAPAPHGEAFSLASRQTLRFGFARDGARGWLAVAGGIDVPVVLGSRATCITASFGGLAGRTLRAGDVLVLGTAHGPPSPAWQPSPAFAERGLATELRILPGPQLGRFPSGALEIMAGTRWTVDGNSDRSGIRLSPGQREIALALAGIAGTAPEGTTLGAIQVTADGGAIALGPDRPVTGGYAKPAVVIAADIGRLALLRPGDAVHFVPTDLDTACALLREREASLPVAVP